MPELPDVTIYVEALRQRIVGQALNRIAVCSPFLLRSADPPLESAHGRNVREVRRLGKRIAIGLEGGPWLVLHLMIAGRLHWRLPGAKPGAALHAVSGEEGLRALDGGGIEVLDATPEAFATALQSANHTLKRALTDPRLFSGIGNAYSDEILHRAQLSPVALTSRLTPDEMARLHRAACAVLVEWIEKLRAASGSAFPERVTAFRPDMAVHGRYGQPCPRCGNRIQRIRYASNETNYCPVCQTGGKLLADRALSRLLREDWPRTLEELEAVRGR